MPPCSSPQLYYYLNKRGGLEEHVFLNYMLADKTSAVFRASPLHDFFQASKPVAPGSMADTPPPGTGKLMSDVKVGDLVTIQDEATGKFYTSPVTAVERKQDVGAFTPLLLDGGLPIVDGVVAYTVSGAPHPLKQLGDFYRQAGVWQTFLTGDAAGCPNQPASCPCLDDPCTKEGTQLAALADGFSPFYSQLLAVRNAAKASGRPTVNWAGLIGEARTAVAGGKVYTRAESLALFDKYHVA